MRASGSGCTLSRSRRASRGKGLMTQPHVTESMTMLTDYLLVIESVAIAVFLYRKAAWLREPLSSSHTTIGISNY